MILIRLTKKLDWDLLARDKIVKFDRNSSWVQVTWRKWRPKTLGKSNVQKYGHVVKYKSHTDVGIQ